MVPFSDRTRALACMWNAAWHCPSIPLDFETHSDIGHRVLWGISVLQLTLQTHRMLVCMFRYDSGL
jgi:hypothetical protein